MFCCHICSGFAFDLITFYLLLAIFNDSSETIRTKGIKDQLCAFFSWRAWLHSWLPGEAFLSQEEKEAKFLFCCGNFKVHYLPSSH